MTCEYLADWTIGSPKGGMLSPPLGGPAPQGKCSLRAETALEISGQFPHAHGGTSARAPRVEPSGWGPTSGAKLFLARVVHRAAPFFAAGRHAPVEARKAQAA